MMKVNLHKWHGMSRRTRSNATTRALGRFLPLELTLEELNDDEKYIYLQQSPPINPVCIDRIHTGDIMLYGNDCLVLFYKSFNTTYSYTRIGKVDNPSLLDEVVGKNDVEVIISKLSA